MEGTLKVTPSELTAKSGQFSAKASQVKALHDEMLAKVNSLSGAWTGSAADAYKAKFSALQSSMNAINRMIMEHSRDLSEMAQQYETGESKAQSIADELPPSNLDY